MLPRFTRVLHRIEDGLLAFALLVLVLLSCGQILMRTGFDSGWIWAEPVSRTLVLWLAMLGALAATREHRHIAIDAFPRLLPARLRRAAWIITQGFAAAVCAALAWYCWLMLQMEREAPVALFGPVESWVGMLILPPGFALMALRFALSTGSAPPPPEREGLG
jgi:TRAP-type C4-dicarboxylate transport system permease small subunit